MFLKGSKTGLSFCWIGVLGYFFILKNRIEKWWPRKKYLVAHKWT